jgi:hypothetical protein
MNQSPINLFSCSFPNSRNGQEGHEYSLQQQQQPSGALGLSLLDQTHYSHNILCNNTSMFNLFHN